MSAENWDKEYNTGVKVAKWEGEDSEDDVKDNWDDEDEPDATPEADSAQKVPQISAKKKNKLVQKIAEKERKEKVNLKPKTAEEILSEKLERQRLQEESDLLLAKEAFGESDGSKTGGSPLDISLNTREDFDTFRKSLVDKLLVYDKSPHFVNFLENLFRELCVSIESDDIKRLSSSLTALFNEKVKAQKAGTKGKKKGKGFSVRVERNDIESGLGNNDLEEFDDFL